MHDALGDHHARPRSEVNDAILQINEQAPFNHIEKLIVGLMLVPVVVPLHNPEPYD